MKLHKFYTLGLILVGFYFTLMSPNVLAEINEVEDADAGVEFTLQEAIDRNFKNISRPSARTFDQVLSDLLETNDPAVTDFLELWKSKNLWFIKATEQIVRVAANEEETLFQATQAATGVNLGNFTKSEIKQIKPNSGVRKKIGLALVGAWLGSEDQSQRAAALEAIAQNGGANELSALRDAVENETVPSLKLMMGQLITKLTITFGKDEAERIAAIKSLNNDLSIEARATLNPLLVTETVVVPVGNITDDNIVGGLHIASRQMNLPLEDAYKLISNEFGGPEPLTREQIKEVLEANISNGQVAGIDVTDLDNWAAREKAYEILIAEGAVDPAVTLEEMKSLVDQYLIVELYTEPSRAVIDAANITLDNLNSKVRRARIFDLFLDGLSLGSIFFLAAIGLAITFGVMRVINMAHGEFIMMGAYTGYVAQLIIPNYTVSLVIALPLAFCVTFVAGILLERTVIRRLYKRPLETLLATFGISISLQQLAKNIFGTQARPLTAPSWLDGAWEINEVVSIAWIRVAIFVLSVAFFVALVLVLQKTRLGLETRAVTQNSQMASAMGINTNQINMITFGLGSGIAGIAGVAIGLFAKVTSELGSDFIVQSFMTVVVGGVGNVAGTLAGAGMIGFLQKGIEWLNPSNTLAAQTYMIVFIIIFIQFRPRGLVALKGRAAGD